MLRSLPIIGPWTNKQRPGGTGNTAIAGGGGGGGDDDDGGGGGLHRGPRNGRFYEEEFAVAPADLLAFDEVSAYDARRFLFVGTCAPVQSLGQARHFVARGIPLRCRPREFFASFLDCSAERFRKHGIRDRRCMYPCIGITEEL